MEVGTVSFRSFDLPPSTTSSFYLIVKPATGDAPSESPALDFTSAVDLAPQECVCLESAEHGAMRFEAFRSTENNDPCSKKLEPEANVSLSCEKLDSEANGTVSCNSTEQESSGILSCEKMEFMTVGAPICERFESKAAVKVQKVYRSYRTRRRLADSAVVAEELWWQAIDYVRLNHSTVSFFNYRKPESAASRWSRVSLNASKVGKGLSQDVKALTLAFQHWIEAIDPRHRYGHNLHIYYEEWCTSDAGQPFFYWLDIGDGRNIDLVECPRSLLREQCITYLGPNEREHYEYVLIAGKITHKQTGKLLDTTKGSKKAKWIFVMSSSKKLYAGQKKKGKFHHSSFLAGGVTLAAGRLVAEEGVLKSIWAYSGHYRPTEDNLNNFLTVLGENGVDLDTVQINSSSNEDYYEDRKQVEEEKIVETLEASELSKLEIPTKRVTDLHLEAAAVPKSPSLIYQRTLSGGLQSPRADVPHNAILKRIESKGQTSSYQLGNQLSLKWSTGAGPRIGCVADYPMELRMQALEFVNLSPRVSTPLSASRWLASCAAMSPAGAACSSDLSSTNANC